MKQLVVSPQGVHFVDAPVPETPPGGVVVRVGASVVSVGTETAVISRRTQQPPPVRRAVRLARRVASKGLTRAMSDLRAEAERVTPLGYSCAGTVVTVGLGVDDLRPGDRVACGGAGLANHAEYVAVPRHLVAPVPPGLELTEAAAATIGAIALHGVRRSGVALGEVVVVVGLGLIGQLAAQMLTAAGGRVLAVDLLPGRLALAAAAGAESVASPSDAHARVLAMSGGRGADAVLMCAAASSAEPMRQALEFVRRKGRLVVVGASSLDVSRDAAYEKEVDILLSCSYGPGRYDPDYELEGLDYPAEHVRWTANRNIAEYLRLAAAGRVSLKSVKPDVVDFAAAPGAYARLRGVDPPCAVVLQQPESLQLAADRQVPTARRALPDGRIGVAVIGLGQFASAVSLPGLRQLSSVFRLHAVVSRDGLRAAAAARSHGAQLASTDIEATIADPAVQAVIICTRHDRHAELAISAARAGKAVLVEKPAALDDDELDRVLAEVGRAGVPFAVGFNRCFSPAFRRARELVARDTGPLVVNYRVLAGRLPPKHWLYGPEGGGRLIGEGCHFVDLAMALGGPELVELTAAAAAPLVPTRLDDHFSLILRHAPGAMSTITYVGVGAPRLGKERIEIFAGRRVLVIDDFRRLEVHGAADHGWSGEQDKGHTALLRAFGEHVQGGAPAMSITQIEAVHRAVFRAARMLRTGAA